PNPVVGSGWPGRGAGSHTGLHARSRRLAKCLIRRGGTGSCLETPLVRCLIAPTRNRSIDPSTEPGSHSGFEVLHRVLHAVDLYYAPAYKAPVPKNPVTDEKAIVSFRLSFRLTDWVKKVASARG